MTCDTRPMASDVAEACERYEDETVRGLKSKRVQSDETWAFVYAKQRNVPEAHKGELGYGDVWTWTALDADTRANHYRQPRSGTHLNLVRGAAEPHDADAHAAVHAADERVLKEAR
jgi:hypothetical protein